MSTNTDMTKAQIAVALKDAGIEFSAKATKADMLALLDAHLDATHEEFGATPIELSAAAEDFVAADVEDATVGGIVAAGAYLAAGWHVVAEDADVVTIDFGDDHVIALPKPMAAQLGAELAPKKTRKPAAPKADKAEVFAAQRAKVVAALAEVAGAEVTTEWTDKAAYTTAKMTLDGKTVSIYVQPNSTNFRPTGVKGEERGKFVAKLAKALKGHTAEAKVRDAGRDTAYVQIAF